MRAIILLASLLCTALAALGQSTGFTYQGRLEDGGAPATGAFDVRFTLFDVAAGGGAISTVVCAEDVPVVNGQFAVVVPLTTPVGDAYLEVQVRAGAAGTCADAAGFTTLSPRTAMTPAPRAVYANAVPATSPTVRGAVRYNPTANRFEGFNGNHWAAFTMGPALPPPNSQVFTTAGTFTFIVPAGVTILGADVWSGGGGGGAKGGGVTATSCGQTNGPFSGGGGAGSVGGYANARMDVTPGESLTVVVGTGGGVSATSGLGGGLSSVARPSGLIVRCFGGRGGSRGLSHSTIPEATVGGCEFTTSGPGGAAATTPQFFGPGALLDSSTGVAAAVGSAASCGDNGFPFCAATGGSPFTGPNSTSLMPQLSHGASGAGETPGGGVATIGSSGAVRLFWN
jgi:hypothetical protein